MRDVLIGMAIGVVLVASRTVVEFIVRARRRRVREVARAELLAREDQAWRAWCAAASAAIGGGRPVPRWCGMDMGNGGG